MRTPLAALALALVALPQGAARAVPTPCVIVESRVESTTGQRIDCPLEIVLL